MFLFQTIERTPVDAKAKKTVQEQKVADSIKTAEQKVANRLEFLAGEENRLKNKMGQITLQGKIYRVTSTLKKGDFCLGSVDARYREANKIGYDKLIQYDDRILPLMVLSVDKKNVEFASVARTQYDITNYNDNTYSLSGQENKRVGIKVTGDNRIKGEDKGGIGGISVVKPGTELYVVLNDGTEIRGKYLPPLQDTGNGVFKITLQSQEKGGTYNNTFKNTDVNYIERK
ncbi:MAG: hypothetical protein WC861_01730 [Candidatus Micrarchaeia archaeon]|jgi:hypothetical protein